MSWMRLTTPRSSRQGTPPAIDDLYFGYRARRQAARLSGLLRSDLVLWIIEIVRRLEATGGFQLLKRRWVVERTLAWLDRNRRLAKDFEASVESAVAWLLIASIKLLTRRLARA